MSYVEVSQDIPKADMAGKIVERTSGDQTWDEIADTWDEATYAWDSASGTTVPFVEITQNFDAPKADITQE